MLQTKAMSLAQRLRSSSIVNTFSLTTMTACCIHLITLFCMVGFQNYMPRCSVASKYHVARLKVKVTIQTCAVNKAMMKMWLFHIHTLGLTAKLIRLFELHGPSAFADL